jgi:hypothetical protein
LARRSHPRVLSAYLASELLLGLLILGRFLSELLGRQQSFPDLLRLELGRHILKFLGELRLHLCLAQRRQMIAILWGPHLKGNISAALLLPQQFIKADNLVQEAHGIQISISFPD